MTENPPYSKPHLSYEKQVDLLEDRGLQLDRSEALTFLKEVGYYRAGAYLYPLRELYPDDQKPSAYQFRQDRFVEGATLSQAIKLRDFDVRLRAIFLQGFEALEVAFRTKIAYELGKLGATSHLNSSILDSNKCNQRRGGDNETQYDKWVTKLKSCLENSQHEDFIKHFHYKYSGDIPIWIAIETLDFGSLTTLFNLLQRDQQKQIAKQFGVWNPRTFASWMQSLRTTRNCCAHHQRLWNRTLNPLPQVPKQKDLTQKPAWELPVGDLPLFESTNNAKVYSVAVILAYFLRQSAPSSDWCRTLRTHVYRKFPDIAGLSPESSMGFPKGWEELSIWRKEPSSPYK